MKLDLHVHSSEYSSCAVASAETQIRAAIAARLDGIAFTNHHKLVPPFRLAEWNAAYSPFRVYGGIEISAIEGEDFLVFGVEDPGIQSAEWEYPKLHAFVRRRGGYIALAHPFRYRHRVDAPVESYPPDAIELRSTNTPVIAEAKIRKMARTLNAKLLCNSDSHSSDKIGRYYNLFKGPLPADRDLAAYLRSAEFKGVSL